MACMGMLFLVCSLYAWFARPGEWTFIFILYGIGDGIHWGGSIGFSEPEIEQGLLLVYLAFSALASSALVHLSLIYPSGNFTNKLWCRIIYSPALLALFFAPFVSLVPDSVLQLVGGIIIILANLFSFIAMIVFIKSLFTVDAEVRRASHLTMIVVVGVSSLIIASLGSEGVLSGNPEAWNLIYAVLPVTFAFALTMNKLASLE